MENTPRRNRIDKYSVAEHAIHEAKRVVECSGSHYHLTKAVILLNAAQESVSDFVDGIPEPKTVIDQISPDSVHGRIASALDVMRRDEKKTRELSLAITKGEELLMWLDRDAMLNR